ncbi:MAG: Hpt domain-containing protein [Kordiimonadaceae bacterium]|nr:Hpt domain-containing protein [Kordiimonadaceae bacterium]
MAGTESNWNEHVVLDEAHLKEFTGGDADFERQILGLFMDHAPGYLRQLEQSGADGWHTMAHKLKGAARSIGAWRLAREAERAEQMGALCQVEPKRGKALKELTVRLGQLTAFIDERNARA